MILCNQMATRYSLKFISIPISKEKVKEIMWFEKDKVFG